MKIHDAVSLALTTQTSPQGSTRFADKLDHAAQELESMLLTDFFSKLRQTFSLDDATESDAGHDTLTGIADQKLCGALASRGGLGLAAMIRRATEKKT